MSRPSSRLSAQSQTTTTAIGSHAHARSSSALSASSSSVAGGGPGFAPFTPGAHNKKSARNSRLGLSAQQVDKLSETIASVKRGPSSHSSTDVHGDRRREGTEGSGDVFADRKGKGRGKVAYAPNTSFIAEASFIEAPLNSRVSTHPSPRRPTARVNSAAVNPTKQPLTTTRLRQIITNNDDEDDNEDDLRGYAQYASGPAPVSNSHLDHEIREDLAQADLGVQEALLIEDLLSVILGIEGQFITFATDYAPEDAFERLRGPRFAIDESIDPSLCDLAAKILPMATYFAAIDTFVETYSYLEFGLTSHALCSAIRDVLKDYLHLVAQLEDQFKSSCTFSLQRFYYFSSEMQHRLFLIYSLISELTTSPFDEDGGDTSTEDGGMEISSGEEDDDDRFGGGKALREAMRGMKTGDEGGKAKTKQSSWSAGGPVKGGEILTIIDERLQRTSGDPIASETYLKLLLRSSQPYAQMLLQWITTGHLIDPYDEFMIRESKSLHTTSLDQDYVDEYWERKYTLKDSVEPAGAASASVAEAPVPGTLDELGRGPAIEGGRERVLVQSRAARRDRGLGGGAIIPAFLEGWKMKVLLAGKYLNVIKECGSSQDLVAATAVHGDRQTRDDVDMCAEGFQSRIDAAYLAANRALLHLLIEQQCLFPRLRSVKHYFFLDQGDAFTHFLDLAAHELGKKSKYASLSKLQSLLDLAIRNPSSSSGIYNDPYKEDVKIAMSSSTLIDWLMKVVNVSGAIGGEDGLAEGAAALPESAGAGQDNRKKDDKHVLTGMDALSLDYSVKFPLSLVISRKAILRYQLIFRHLLQLKHLEMLLTANWLEHTKAPVWRKCSRHPDLEKWKGRIFTLRARMLAFVQQLFTFCVNEVLECNWIKLMSKLENVGTVDELLRCHVDFLDTCLKECMLTNPKLLKLQSKLMSTCSLFVSYNSKLAKAANHLSTAVDQAIERGEEWTSVSIKQEDEFLQKFEINFFRHQKIHADTVTFHALSDTGALLALVVRLQNTVPEADGLPS